MEISSPKSIVYEVDGSIPQSKDEIIPIPEMGLVTITLFVWMTCIFALYVLLKVS